MNGSGSVAHSRQSEGLQHKDSLKGASISGQMSIDEDVLLKLLNDDLPEDGEASPLQTAPETHGSPGGESAPGDLEQELAAELMLCDEPHENGVERKMAVDATAPGMTAEEKSNDKELCPVTPEDVIDVLRRDATDTGSSGRAGKDSSTDESSIEAEVQNGTGVKRRANDGLKSSVKKTKYYEADKTVKKQGWAEELLKRRREVLIPQNPIPVKPKKVEEIDLVKKAPPPREPMHHRQGAQPQPMMAYGNVRAVRRREFGHQRQRDESMIPPGWMDCPGLENKWGFFLFSKTPLGECWNHLIPQDRRYTPQNVLWQAAEKKWPIGLVIDLTNSSLYYDPSEFERHGVKYCKIRCRGHGMTPSPEAVNAFWWTVFYFERQKTGRFIFVHCTHGFNRTGFMVAHFTKRWALQGDMMNRVIRTFAVRRPPGIYKDEYINDLLDYYHEPRSSTLITPSVPSWKSSSEEEREDEQQKHAEDETRSASRVWSLHGRIDVTDNRIGEWINPAEQCFLQDEILNLMLVVRRNFRRFPGAQPVSMDRNNIEMLSKKRYWVTYKADGTRYMLLLMRYGVFVINRDFQFQRVEMRFPVDLKVGPDNNNNNNNNPGSSHHMTLLDGEMVIDYDKESGHYTRKYLVYDLVLFRGQSWMNLPWKQRFAQIEEIVNIRNAERKKIDKGQWPYQYQYSEEPFAVEAKIFRCMGQIHSLNKIVKSLHHECDGFIFQAYEDQYRIGTHEELLKWKYPNLNSVDFRYHHSEDGGKVFLMKGNEILCENVKVVFKNKEDALRYSGKIVECTYDDVNDLWEFHRERVDKKTPNAYSVYEKVLQSIRDNITEEELVNKMLDLFNESDVYMKDREKLAALDATQL